MSKVLYAVLACVALAGCNAGGSVPSANLPTMSVAFKWCSGSPEFTVGNIPAGAKTLNFRMVDQQAQGYNHGGGSVAASGKSNQTVPCGGLTGSYTGPNPPSPQVHEYQWTVTAVDASGQAVAVGRAIRKFPE